MRIALFLPNWVGDVVMATPAVAAVRDHFPAARILGVGRPFLADLLAGSPWVDEFIAFDRGTWAAARRLRRERPDWAVLFPNSFRSALTAWLGGCRRRVGYARSARSLLLTDRLPPVRDERGRFKPSPIIDAYNLLVAPLGGPPPPRTMRLFTTPIDEAAADAVWQAAGWSVGDEVICLNPGAAFGAAKHWPGEHFAELARNLIHSRGCRVLVLCGPSERDLARRIAGMAGRPGVHTLADAPVSLGLSKACVRRSALLVTTDSGPRHFAAAFDRPVLTLFGPTHIAWTETFHPKAEHVQKPVPCGPCQQRVCPLGHHRCMTELSPAEVLDRARRLLDRHDRREVRHAG